ncbi:MAG: hypothetical protein RMJ15_06375 [Nitrososphaerota archaeon]|nr:hypothetical protein [Candidatus Bathyarchaeota archaeon]MDW8023344.1 hypothetical protein [Nitrososphaerota archaeon]
MAEEKVEAGQMAESQTVNVAVIDGGEKSIGEEALERLKAVLENVGHMFELSKEESSLINEFFSALAVVMRPFCEVLEVSVSSLPKSFQAKAGRAFLDGNGQLIVVKKNGGVEILNLVERKNREVVVQIIDDVMAKLGDMIIEYKSRVEKRVKVLLSVTKELQSVAKIFEEL